MKLFINIIFCTLVHLSIAINGNIITNFTINVVKTNQAVVFGCTNAGLLSFGRALMKWNQGMMLLNMNKNYSLRNVLTRKNHAKTSVILDCSCLTECKDVLKISSEGKYFNKTYQWMILDSENNGLDEVIGDLRNIGPNSQTTYVNNTENGTYSFFDVHSKGRHLNAPLEVIHYADWKTDDGLIINRNIFELQGIRHRDQFNQLKLRGATVIDQDNITSNSQIIPILSSSGKEDGVAAFTKYHYVLSTILQERFNFTLNFRNLRGWAGRLRGGIFRLGFLGAVMRNEVDVGASGAFNRINRFADYDTIHQSWKFDSAFMYRFTSDIDADGKSVVGGLLNSSEQGPKTVSEIVNSPLKLSFEDIGYYKVLFKNPTNPLVIRMYNTKVLPERGSDELEVFTHIKEAIPFLKKGGYAFHCERVDAYPEIARHFDANEICDLRIVSGLMDKGLMNWIVSKNSMYTEIFRVMMCRARETGIVMRTLTMHQPKRPECQASYTVYPVAISGVLSAFILLGVGILLAFIILTGEIIYYRLSNMNNLKFK